MSRLRISVGIFWVLWPLAPGAFELFLLATGGFEDWPRWVPLQLVLLFISACGVYYLLGWPGAKWVLSVVAFLVAIYLGVAALIFGANDPGESFQWLSAAPALAGMAAAIFSIVVARRA